MNKDSMKDIKNNWWKEEYGFFGDFYIDGDNSEEGYLIDKKQSLEERTRTEVDGVFKLLSLKKGMYLLDCPCGYARHSIELASRGLIVTGVDINSTHLNNAKKAADLKKVKVDFKRESMIDIKYDSEFDVIINMFYSFGFFDTDTENEKVLFNFFNALKPGGKFLMHTDVNIPRIISGKYKNDEIRLLKSGKELRIIDKYNPLTKKIEGKWIITDRDGKKEEKDYFVRVYTKDEFEQLCYKVGFSKVTTYSNWEGDNYFEDSEDMIVVAEK